MTVSTGMKARRSGKEAPVEGEPTSDKADARLAPEQLRLRELVARVAEATGEKGKDIKAAVEATLAELGRALEAGETLNLAGLGKARVARVTQTPTGQVLVVKLRRDAASRRPEDRKEPLADAGEAR